MWANIIIFSNYRSREDDNRIPQIDASEKKAILTEESIVRLERPR